LLLVCGCAFAQTRLTLQDAEALAVKNHPAVSAALLNALAANQVTTEVRAAYFPTVTGSVTAAGALEGTRLAAGSLNNPVIFNRFATGASISQIITDFGRTPNLVAQARHRAEAAQSGAQATRAQVLLQVDRAYFTALRTQNVLTVAQETVNARKLVSDQVSALANSKLKSGLDVSFANVNLSEAKLLLVSAVNEAAAAMAELSDALGYPGRQQFQLADAPMPPDLTEDAAGLITEALRNRPEVAQFRAQQSAAESFARAERDLARPTLSALAGLGVVPLRDETQLRGRYAAAGVNLNIPVFNGFLFSARRQEAELRAQAAQKDVAGLENRVARDVEVALLNANTARDRMSLTTELLNEANQALDLAQTRYNLGLSSIVELSQAQLNKTSAEIASAAARYDYQLQRAVLSYQTGELR
jgi:outer membrane protein